MFTKCYQGYDGCNNENQYLVSEINIHYPNKQGYCPTSQSKEDQNKTGNNELKNQKQNPDQKPDQWC